MDGLDEELTVLNDKIEAVEASLLAAKSDSDIAYFREKESQLREKERQLREKERQLREKESQLREKEIILLRRQDASGININSVLYQKMKRT
jgi:hypothetical protein